MSKNGIEIHQKNRVPLNNYHKRTLYYIHKTLKVAKSNTIWRFNIMQITDIKVRKLFQEGPMKAIVSVTFDGQLAVHDIKIINARDKFFIVMPSRKNPDDTYRDIVHPINAQFRGMLEAAVIEAYEAALAQAETEGATAEEEFSAPTV